MSMEFGAGIEEIEIAQEIVPEEGATVHLERLADFLQVKAEPVEWMENLLNADPVGREYFFKKTELPKEYLGDYLKELAHPTHGYLSYVVRDAGNTPIGFCYLDIYRDRGMDGVVVRLAKVAIYLHPERQEKGLGKATLEQLKAVSAENHIDELVIQSDAENHRMQRVAEKCGAVLYEATISDIPTGETDSREEPSDLIEQRIRIPKTRS